MARNKHFSPQSSRTNGFSLILVLGSLVLLSTLIVAFLTGMSSELKSSKLYADGSSVRMLSQSAVNIVLAEIKEATQYTGNKTWASQPGMIRTYDSQAAKKEYYKLYSDPKMVDSGEFNPLSAQNAVPANWAAQKAFYTDLNEPVTSTLPGGTTTFSAYPIIDGNNLSPMAAVGGNKTYGTGNVPDIDGFSVSTTAPATSTNSVPMPVSWLYVLANGQVVAPTGTGTTATINGASQANPIVGRIAFWTDDETCKVNINTAAEGTYWDSPKVANTTYDLKYALNQPAQREYQRYPGHPATTCLSAIFKTLTAEQLYTIVPRVTGGPDSSLGGTQAGKATLAIKTDRLYSSTDELLFKQPASSDIQRSPNSSSVITKSALEKAKFFITASSRAPDVNLFGKPRVCIWPIYYNEQDANYTTAYDRLIAFCSKIGGFDYFFRRQSPISPTNDLPSNPGNTGLERNRTLLNYLKSFTTQNIPGFSGNFETKYGALNRDQLLTEIFDYIRSTNTQDPTVTVPFSIKMGSAGVAQVVPVYDAKTSTRGFGRFPTVQGAFLVFIAQPITDAAEKASRPHQVKLQAAFFVNLFTPAFGYPQTTPLYGMRVSGLENFVWRGVDTSGKRTTLATSMGFPAAPSGQVNVAPSVYGTNGTIGLGGSVDFNWFVTGQTNTNANLPSTKIYSNWPGYFRYALISTQTIYVKDTDDAFYSSDPDTTFDFNYNPAVPGSTGSDVTIELVAPNANGNYGEVVQTVTLSFPPATCKSPSVAPTVAGINYTDFFSRFDKASAAGHPLFAEKDTVIAVVPKEGDLRLAMPRRTIVPGDGIYTTHSNYPLAPTMTAVQFAHNLRNESHDAYFGSIGGRLLSLPFYGAPLPATASNTATYGALLRDSLTLDSSVVPTNTDILKDWDNAVGRFPDGPFINKADEGDSINTGSSVQIPYFDYYTQSIGATLFSPNRMMPSAGMFGSLPTGVWSKKAWQTLLFCPNPLAGNSHPGFATPADYLILDLFNMPVVEPYAISEPLSTAGRINMNYQIIPFTYINRDTGIRAILKSERLIAISDSDSKNYKDINAKKAKDIRYSIDPDETLKGFQSRFAQPDLFRSPAEFCNLYLVPGGVGASYSTMASWWNNYRLTGDNSRERPYTTIYPRLTTQSNTYTIHMRVQTLKKARTATSLPNQWQEGTDIITGEYRGSQTIERYVDPTDVSLVDFTATGAPTLDKFYRFRTVTSKQFNP